ncbi:MAG: SagB/ThcOx family dehydrogenase [Actinomycetota bacterium]|nr:SagB/ThcOx family dehydrogenase [Actinomycetota bacterium]
MRSASLIFGSAEPPQDDPAEAYHEASKLYPSFAARQTRGRLLESHLGLRVSSLRSVKRSDHMPTVSLPEPALPATPFGHVVEERRSERAFGEAPLTLEQIGSLLHAGYGTTHELGVGVPGPGPPLRAVPSGGGLFPLEVYVLPWRVRALPLALYHFDPLRRVLERLRSGDLEGDVRAATVYHDLALGCGALFLVAGVFWRTRFKYGLRGYRFALLECGHLAQNILLAATALGLGSVPIGGFYDRRVDELLGLDGVNESALYAVAVGVREEAG